MNNNEFKDSLNTISDEYQIRGEVEMIDLHNGKIIFHDHNMIVQGGRDFVRKLILFAIKNKFETPLSTEATYNRATDFPYLNLLKFGTGSDASVLSKSEITSITTSGSNEEIFVYTVHGSDPTKKVDLSFDATADSERLKLVCTVRGEDNLSESSTGTTLSELGLFLSDGNLFSRITFDPITVNASSEFELKYYIYF